jgi:hypothetical protein
VPRKIDQSQLQVLLKQVGLALKDSMLAMLARPENLNYLAIEAVKEVSRAKNRDKEKNNNTLMEPRCKLKPLNVEPGQASTLKP